MSLALLFPGQGSQSVGMGRELAGAFPEAARVFEEADDLLGFSLSRLAWEGPPEELTETRNAQPALLVHSTAVHRVLASDLGSAHLAAGHSLGEFSAHVAVGTLSFAEAVRVVRTRGELMFEAGTRISGTMAAVLGLDDREVERVCREAAGSGGSCVPANFNSPGQVVISGDPESVLRAGDLAREAGARRVLPLNVSGAFHSPLMEPAMLGLREELARVNFHAARIPVVSNVTADPVGGGDEARRLLAAQLTAPVQWSRSILAMADRGTTRFLELGPGSVLSGLTRRILGDADSRSAGEPQDVERTLEWLAGES